MANDSGTRRYSAADLEKLRAGGESRTDMARLRALSDGDAERAVADDPDFQGVPENWYLAAEAVMPTPKKLLSLRLDADVIDWFKRQGPGYQTRINAVLRAFVEHTGDQRP